MRNIYKTSDIKNLSKFSNSDEQLCVINRQKPINTCIFFKKLMEIDIRIIGNVSKKNGISEITNLLKDAIPDELKHYSFYSLWISDMAHICKLFCEFVVVENPPAPKGAPIRAKLLVESTLSCPSPFLGM